MHFYYHHLILVLYSGCMGYLLSLLFILGTSLCIAYTYLKFGAQSGYEPLCLVMRQAGICARVHK